MRNRRQFIKNSSLLGAVATLPPFLGNAAFAGIKTMNKTLYDFYTTADIAALRAAVLDGEYSAGELMEEAIRLLDENKNLNALQYADTARAREAAKHPKPGDLSGVPFVAKDNINSSAMPTSAGTKTLLQNTPKHNAPALQRLLDAGALLLGKAGMHELAFGITSNNAATGAIKNPRDLSRIPGGSSGGTAAAVAAGIVPFGLGTDTGGSCRIPAALCGVVGFRPTTGRYPANGLVPISPTRDTVGTLARCVEDIILLDGVLAGTAAEVRAKPADGVTLGMDESLLCQNLADDVQQAFDRAVAKLQAAGVRIKKISLAEIWQHNTAFSFPVVLYEVMRELPAYLQTHAPDVSFATLLANIESPDVKGVFESQRGEGAIPEEAYRAALNTHRPVMREIYRNVFAQNGLDALLFPTTPLTAAKIGEDETVLLNGEQVPTFPTYIRNTDLGSNLGVPGISLPAPAAGLPVGIELDGSEGGDAALFAVAKTVENILAAS